MKILVGVFLLFCVFSCTDRSDPTSSIVNNKEQGLVIGKNLKAKNFETIYFSGQPDNEDLLALKEQGFETIINLRKSSEYDEVSEAKLSKELGFHYKQIPFDGRTDQLTDEFISSVTKVVMDQRDKGKILIHCGSGNRVALWVGGHFAKDHKYSAKDAIEMAKKMGLTSAGLEKKLKVYLQKI